MGELAANIFFDKRESIDYYRSLQGIDYSGIKVYITYNPLELIDKIDLKRLAWIDLQIFQKRNDITNNG
jgi:hypothetical protein